MTVPNDSRNLSAYRKEVENIFKNLYSYAIESDPKLSIAFT